MPKFGEILKSLREEKRLTQDEVAEAIEVDSETISRLERADAPPKKGNSYRRLVEFYGRTVKQIDTLWMNTPLPIPGNFTIPRVSTVAANDFREYPVDLMNREGVPGQLYPFPAHDPMVLRVAGSSMLWSNPDAIYDGDDVIFGNELEEDIPENTIVVARNINTGTQTVKRVHYVDAQWLELVPQNPTFPTLKSRRDELVLRAVKVIVGYPYRRK